MKDSLRNLVVKLGRFTRMNVMDLVLLGPDEQKVKLSWYDSCGLPWQLDLSYSKRLPDGHYIEGSTSISEAEVKTGKLGPDAFDFYSYIDMATVVEVEVEIDTETKSWTLDPHDLEKLRNRVKRKSAYYHQLAEYADQLE